MTVFQFLTHVLIGTIAGGMSDTVAVWMLFHPRKKILGFQGAIPKNQARLAKSLGRTVGERLLTPDDILAELTRAGFREMLDSTLASVLTGLLEKERRSLRDELPENVVLEIERALAEAVPMIVGRLDDFVQSPEFERKAASFVARTRLELADRPLGNVLSAERRGALTKRAESWAEELAASPKLEEVVRDYIDRNAHALLDSDAPLIDRVPPAIIQAIEGGIDAYLPLAAEKLGSVLRQPASRDRLRGALHELFGRFVDDLKFHERVIARLVVTERTFDKALDSIESDGVEQLASLLDDPEMRAEITRTIQSGLTAYLQKPMKDIVGAADSPRAKALVVTAGDYLLRVLRAEQTRRLLIEKLDDVLEKAEARTWGQLMAPLDDATVAAWLVAEARSERSSELVADIARGAIAKALDKPIGRPGRWLPPDTANRLSRVLTPAVWGLIETQLPILIQRLDVQSMVERKVLAFSTERLEELIRGVIQKELRLIILCGYILGGLIAVVGTGASIILGW